MTIQERQQGFLADFNAWHEIAKKKYGYALTIVPATGVVHTPEGPRVEIGLKFGLQDLVPPTGSQQTGGQQTGGHIGPPLPEEDG